MIGRWWPIIFYSRMSVYRTHSDGSKNDWPQIGRPILYKVIWVGKPIFVSNPNEVRSGNNVCGLNWVWVVTIIFIPSSYRYSVKVWPILGQSFLLPADRTLGIDKFESKMIDLWWPIIFDSNLSLPSVWSAGSKNDWPRIGQTFTEYL